MGLGSILRVLLAAAALAIAGIPHAAYARADVTVFAAASLREGLEEAARAFEAKSGARVTAAYGGTPALARQIERGAPADVFISADLDWMRYLEDRGLVRSGSRVNLLTNGLVLIAPAGSPIALDIGPGFPLAAALGNGRLAMADVEAVPAGKYGRAALEALGVWKEVAPSTVRAANVRAALAFVARGEAPLGIVYRTDALAEPKVKVIVEFPAGTHPPIVYPAAIVAASRSPAAAPFLEFLRSPAARAVWRRHGFGAGG